MADGAGGQTGCFTVFDDEVIACAGTAETSSPPTVPTGKASTCCCSLPACEKSFLTTRKEYAICRSHRQI